MIEGHPQGRPSPFNDRKQLLLQPLAGEHDARAKLAPAPREDRRRSLWLHHPVSRASAEPLLLAKGPAPIT